MSDHTCTVAECARPVLNKAKQLCSPHYQQQWRGQPFTEPVPRWKGHKCSVEGCDEAVRSVGLCSVHYDRKITTGDVGPAHRKQFSDPEMSFWAKTQKTDSCWVWTGAKVPRGYGKMTAGGKQVYTHRWSYARFKGEIPEGMQVDHMCFNTSCVNPDHLRLATPKQNSENQPGARGKTGVRNVVMSGKKFLVQVGSGGKTHYFGTYETLAEAEQVAISARAKMFTHSQN